jgi:hypothetical protein
LGRAGHEGGGRKHLQIVKDPGSGDQRSLPLCAKRKKDWHRENVQPENAKIV